MSGEKNTLNDIIRKFQDLENLIMESDGEITDDLDKILLQNDEDLSKKLDGYEKFSRYLKGQVEYLKTAESTDRINTPSYSQVIKPIYKHATGRWECYKKQISNIYPILEPWIKRFKY